MNSHEYLLKNNKIFQISSLNINNKNIISLYIFMKKLRLIEDALSREYHPADEMRCPVHFCNGQEVIPAVLNNLLLKNDYLFSHHRSHGYFLAKNSPPEKLFAEIYGRKTGANSGLAGSQDISYPKNNFFAGAILSGSIAIAVGTAMSLDMMKKFKKKNIVVTGFGDAATDQGIFWESLSYASLKKLPIIFVCENNNYSVFSPQKKRQVGKSIADKVKSFGINSKQIFGNHIGLVYNEVKNAITEARKGKGPFFLETITYRFNGHVGPLSDDLNSYRSEKELEFWKKNCPIKLLEDYLLKKNIINLKKLNKIKSEIENKIVEYFKYAKKSSFLNLKSFTKLNYSSKSPMAIRLLKETDKSSFDINQENPEIKGY